MQDRVPRYPGRVTLTPVPGQANTYDMVRADQPTQMGDALNKANLLPDDVAAALATFFGAALPSNPQVKDVFDKISKMSQVKIAAVSYIGTGAKGASAQNSLTFSFEPKLLFIFTDPMYGKFGYRFVMWIFNSKYMTSEAQYGIDVVLSSDKKTISWYAGDADTQMNTLSATYQAVSIG